MSEPEPGGSTGRDSHKARETDSSMRCQLQPYRKRDPNRAAISVHDARGAETVPGGTRRDDNANDRNAQSTTEPFAQDYAVPRHTLHTLDLTDSAAL